MTKQPSSTLDTKTKYSELPEELKRYRDDIFDDKYKRLDADSLSRTITAHIAKDGYWYVHPRTNRTLTIREAARIQTFPDHFRFAGSPTAALRQIGNAVPPRLARAIGSAVADVLVNGAGDVAIRTGMTRSALADWGRESNLVSPWLRSGSRWLVVLGDALLGAESATTTAALWPMVGAWSTPERSPLSLSEALNVSIQVADALSAAHKAGIIHRDIKPENVMLRPDGYVKVLDFGLAKLSEQATADVAAEAPTIQVRTGSGIVIGTAGYMSPEQARGIAVDGRSDIFSLGAMIYEMVARRKPFEGDTPSDTLASILKTDPPPLLQLLPRLPPELNRIVSKSLRKDREERYQVVKDLWLDLKSLKQELEFQEKLERSVVPESGSDSAALGEPTSVVPLAQTTEPRSAITLISESLSVEIKRHKTRAVLALAGVVAVLLLGAFAIYKYANRTPPVTPFWDIKLSRITSSGDVIDSTISPDGKYIVYALSSRSNQSLYIRQVSTANDTEILAPAPVGIFGMTFSPDGDELYYVIKSNLDNGTLFEFQSLAEHP